MLLTRREIPILVVNLIYIPIFTVMALRRTNYEFVLYVGVILIAGGWILFKQRTIRFDRTILWGLTIWGLLHMSGGNIHIGDGVLYDSELIRVLPAYHILRYDQLVHMFGFGIVTLLCHHLLRPYLREGITRWAVLSFLIVLMGSGFGALNEIVEFIAVETVPETGVGGYQNTALDLVFNLVGGTMAICWLAWRRRRERSARLRFASDSPGDGGISHLSSDHALR